MSPGFSDASSVSSRADWLPRCSNADLRMVFYRVCDFLAQGVLAVFIFDGPDRPSWKRDKNVAGAWRGRSERDVITLLELMGMEWRRAPGEAEAELAEMSRRGEVDAILSVRSPPPRIPFCVHNADIAPQQDDVDSLLFGVTQVRCPTPSRAASSCS